MLTAQDINGVYAILATPAKDGADRWDATATVDLDETARLTEQLIADGVDGLIVLGTTGECATLTKPEFESFVDCFLSTVDKRVPTYVGATCLGTHDIVERLRFVQERGADGTMLGLPMWQPCTEDMAVKFYASIAEAFPELAIMVYANENAFRFNFPPSFWEKVVQAAPTVTSAKFASPVGYAEALAAVDGKVNFLPIDMLATMFAEMAPDSLTAVWSTASSMGPQPTIALMRALQAKDMDRAQAVATDLFWANETFIPGGDFVTFAHYNIQSEKVRFNEAGYCKAGPIRPPYDVIPDEWAEGARECGRRWAQLAEKYRDAR
jgi:dihydrodipicolinate synthase/N-acetylneuraminate lyase